MEVNRLRPKCNIWYSLAPAYDPASTTRTVPLPARPGCYALTRQIRDEHHILYIGKTEDLNRRLLEHRNRDWMETNPGNTPSIAWLLECPKIHISTLEWVWLRQHIESENQLPPLNDQMPAQPTAQALEYVRFET